MNLIRNKGKITKMGNYYSKSVSINIKVLFLSVLMIFAFIPLSSNAQSWLDYNYRRALTITNSGGSTLTDYQVLITLTSSNFNNNFPQTRW